MYWYFDIFLYPDLMPVKNLLANGNLKIYCKVTVGDICSRDVIFNHFIEEKKKNDMRK